MRTRIFDIENWREIGATLARNKTRTFLTAFGIFWGTAMLAMLWGGAGGLEGMLRRNFSGFATNMGGCFASRTTMPYRGFNKGSEWDITQTDIDYLRRSCSLIDLSSTVGSSGGIAKFGTKSTTGHVLGVESDYFRMQVPVISEGRAINESDVSASRKVIMLGKDKAAELFAGQPAVGEYVSVNGIYFKVIGVAAQTSEASIGGRMDNAFIMPASTFRNIFNRGNRVDFFIFTAKQGHSPSEVFPYAWRVFCSNHPLNPADKDAMWRMDISENFKMVDNLFIGISILALFVGLGTLLAGIIGVGNIMWIIVKERTQEIGVRRAIGAKPRDIITQILTESMVLTAIAGIAGICFATGVLYIADSLTFDPLLGSAHFQLRFSHAVTIMVTFLILGSAAGLIPAIKAMRIKPIEALNDK